jgi:flagellar protein FliS
MDTRNAASLYREAAFENAPPIKIVRLLYQGALRFLDQAAAETPGGVSSRFAYHLVRADSIVAELRLALRKDVAPQIADELEQLYLFVEERLRLAIKERDQRHVAAARQVLVNLLEAWQHVEVSARAG